MKQESGGWKIEGTAGRVLRGKKGAAWEKKRKTHGRGTSDCQGGVLPDLHTFTCGFFHQGCSRSRGSPAELDHLSRQRTIHRF